MGTSQSCQQCASFGPPGTSVISFSDDLLNRVTGGKIDQLAAEKLLSDKEHECHPTQVPKRKIKNCKNLLDEPDQEDKAIFESLECMDKKLTEKYNLTYEYVDKMTTDLIERINTRKHKEECAERELVLKCYDSAPDNILDCEPIILKYMDCVDVARWQALKKFMKCDIEKVFDSFKCKTCCR